MKIDIHTHIIPENWPDLENKFGYGGWISLDHYKKNEAKMIKNGKSFRIIECNCWDPLVRIDECKKNNVDVQVLSTIPALFNYWAKPDDALFTSKFINDHISMIVNDHPKHFLGLGTLPMQDEKKAILELERCIKELGLAGIQIGSNINGLNLNEPSVLSIFEVAREMGASVFVHPWDIMGKDEMEKYWLPWLVGMPAETSRAICSMIFGGVFEQLPDLRVAFAHGGGAFPATVDYLGKFWVDSLVHDMDMLRYLIDKVGDKKITLGSDYPFPLGEQIPGSMIEKSQLKSSIKENILYKNALDWLGLSHDHFS